MAFDLVVFGGGGNLGRRKLLPALFFRDAQGELPEGTRIVVVGRSAFALDDYVGAVRQQCQAELDPGELEAEAWARFAGRIQHVRLDATDAEAVSGLTSALGDDETRERVYYLATAPELFGPICRALDEAGLVASSSKVVMEKPIGHDLESSRAINAQVGAVFPEERIYRIDHYLGKETVQNLMVLRFANVLFERLWNAREIDHVQITVAESIGVDGRGAYYDSTGALRDMVQNHLLQLLCLVAMEPPVSWDADAVRDEKIKVLRSLRPIPAEEVGKKTVRGRYSSGTIGGRHVPAYTEEHAIDATKNTETFAIVKAEVDNWRWAGVPFYLRTGKRLAARRSEIVVQFKQVPHLIFPERSGRAKPNRLVLRLQPDEGVQLMMLTKVPGRGGVHFQEVPLNLSFAEAFEGRSPGAYERLLMDVAAGDPTLFMRRDEVEGAWRWLEPILDGWAQSHEPVREYSAGSWGPSAAIALIERDGRTWHEDLA